MFSYAQRQLNKEEIIIESRGNVASQHFDKSDSIEPARKNSGWENMESEICEYYKKCLICKTQKLTRIRLKV